MVSHLPLLHIYPRLSFTLTLNLPWFYLSRDPNFPWSEILNPTLPSLLLHIYPRPSLSFSPDPEFISSKFHRSQNFTLKHTLTPSWNLISPSHSFHPNNKFTLNLTHPLPLITIAHFSNRRPFTDNYPLNNEADMTDDLKLFWNMHNWHLQVHFYCYEITPDDRVHSSMHSERYRLPFPIHIYGF